MTAKNACAGAPEAGDGAAGAAWMGFLQLWKVEPQHLAEAMRQAAQIEGLEHLAWTADRYEEAVKA